MNILAHNQYCQSRLQVFSVYIVKKTLTQFEAFRDSSLAEAHMTILCRSPGASYQALPVDFWRILGMARVFETRSFCNIMNGKICLDFFFLYRP